MPDQRDARISRALEAESQYLKECDRRRTLESLRLFNNAGAAICAMAPAPEERVRRMLEAADRK